MDKELDVNPCIHRYSRSDSRPRKCLECGKLEFEMKVEPLSPSDISIELPDFVIEVVNAMIKKKYRGSSFSFKAKELIALKEELKLGPPNVDWYAEKWMDFEKVYRERGWKVRYEQPAYGDSHFDAYYEFTPK